MLDEKNENTQKILEKKNCVSKRHRGVVLFFVFLLLGLACFLLWHFLQRPAVGTIRPGTVPLAEESFNKEKEKKHFGGKYVDFSHGAAYQEKRRDVPVNSPIKESIFLSAEGIEGRKIALILADRGTSDLASDPSFQVRSDSLGEYQSKPFQVATFQGTVFQKKTQIFEATAFFSHRGHIVSVSLTSPFSVEGLEIELLDIVESLRFTLD